MCKTFFSRSESVKSRVVSLFHELLHHVLPCYSRSKTECVRNCFNFGYQNSLMMCSCEKRFFPDRSRSSLEWFLYFMNCSTMFLRLKTECVRNCFNFGYQNSLMMCSCEKRFFPDRSRSSLEWFLYFMNCSTMFFHVILDLKLNVSETVLTLATRIV